MILSFTYVVLVHSRSHIIPLYNYKIINISIFSISLLNMFPCTWGKNSQVMHQGDESLDRRVCSPSANMDAARPHCSLVDTLLPLGRFLNRGRPYNLLSDQDTSDKDRVNQNLGAGVPGSGAWKSECYA